MCMHEYVDVCEHVDFWHCADIQMMEPGDEREVICEEDDTREPKIQRDSKATDEKDLVEIVSKDEKVSIEMKSKIENCENNQGEDEYGASKAEKSTKTKEIEEEFSFDLDESKDEDENTTASEGKNNGNNSPEGSGILEAVQNETEGQWGENSLENEFAEMNESDDALIPSSQPFSDSSDLEMLPLGYFGLNIFPLPSESRCMQESLAITKCSIIPFTDIQSIKSHPKAPYRFRCRARVLYYEPIKVGKMLQVSCETCSISTTLEFLQTIVKVDESPGVLKCAECSDNLEVSFLLFFLLEDQTGILSALLCGADALQFFSSFNISKLCHDVNTQKELEKKLAQLTLEDPNSLQDLGQDISPRPFFECSIKSYHGDHQAAGLAEKQSVCYQIFDTSLV